MWVCVSAGDDEVSFLANDVITHIDTSLDAGWWMGSCNGSSGLFPANFVEVSSPIPFSVVLMFYFNFILL